MISFKKFVRAVHDAILSANETLMDQNLGLLDQYFEQTSAPAQQEAGKPDEEPAPNLQAAPGDKLRAKSVVIEYPQQTSTGVQMVDVQVPLITLVPVTTTQIEKVTLKAEFQLSIINDELQLLFPKERPPKKKSFLGLGPSHEGTFGEIEITISPSESPAGLNELVEGYEKALKSQIPH